VDAHGPTASRCDFRTRLFEPTHLVGPDRTERALALRTWEIPALWPQEVTRLLWAGREGQGR